VQGVADKMKHDPDLWSALGGVVSADITANQVHFALVPEALRRMGRRLTVEQGQTRIALSF
jgi:hypothetical protein